MSSLVNVDENSLRFEIESVTNLKTNNKVSKMLLRRGKCSGRLARVATCRHMLVEYLKGREIYDGAYCLKLGE